MAQKTVAVYLSDHGFGHGVRGTMLLEGLLARREDVRVALATRLPAWLHGRLERVQRHESMGLPPPMVQRDSLSVDHVATGALLRRRLRGWQADVDEHARWLRQIGAGFFVEVAWSAMAFENSRSLLRQRRQKLFEHLVEPFGIVYKECVSGVF